MIPHAPWFTQKVFRLCYVECLTSKSFQALSFSSAYLTGFMEKCTEEQIRNEIVQFLIPNILKALRAIDKPGLKFTTYDIYHLYNNFKLDLQRFGYFTSILLTEKSKFTKKTGNKLLPHKFVIKY